MPLLNTSGSATADGYGGGVAAVPNYIEDVFSTWLYTGTTTTQSITNNIDLSTKGGMVWLKKRDGVTNQAITDTTRGANNVLYTNLTNASSAVTYGVNSFSTTGFGITGSDQTNNASGGLYASWTFRKQPKFFDVVTYTGNGTTQNIAHNLGSVPGCIIVKSTSDVNNWFVYHTSLGATNFVYLNATSASASTTLWNNTAPTSSVFSVGSTASNNAGSTYVAYLFADNAGGFGLTGTDNVISCGSFNAASVTTTTLGYEPQWLMFKRTDSTGNWRVVDNMRGWPASGNPLELNPNLTAAETSNGGVNITSTGFTNVLGTGTFIYVAVRRGPMKVPTDATKVFQPVTYTGTTLNTDIGTMGPIDAFIVGSRDGYGTSYSQFVFDRLRGGNVSGQAPELGTANTGAEVAFSSTVLKFDVQAGWNTNTSTTSYINGSGYNYVSWNFKRAPSFFDEVCYTGTGANAAITHNLGVAPELTITKTRSLGTEHWNVWQKDLGSTGTPGYYYYLQLDATTQKQSSNDRVSTVTSTVVNVGNNSEVNGSGATYVMYLFATCPGVSKVGSYTGTGATQTISCGFTGGARWVMIKCAGSTGGWYVWDTARGMVAGTDPSLRLNSNTAEVNANSIYTTTGGFQIVSTAAEINANGDTYIYLAIA